MSLRLAEARRDIIAIDACQPLEGVPYEMPGPKDLEATVSMVEERGRRVVSPGPTFATPRPWSRPSPKGG